MTELKDFHFLYGSGIAYFLLQRRGETFETIGCLIYNEVSYANNRFFTEEKL